MKYIWYSPQKSKYPLYVTDEGYEDEEEIEDYDEEDVTHLSAAQLLGHTGRLNCFTSQIRSYISDMRESER